jgi:acetyl esterase
MRAILVATAAVTISFVAAQGQGPQSTPVGKGYVYKTAGGQELHAYVSEPTDPGLKHPAIVFFHGGGWTGGRPAQFNLQSTELAARGMVAVDIEYRLIGKPPSTENPQICLEDATELRVDPTRIAAGGGSAGGYLAAAVALVPGWSDPADDQTISPKPGALVLLFPVVNIDPAIYKQGRFGDDWKPYSPYEYLTASAPPTLIEAGGADNAVKPAAITGYKAKCDQVGARCQVDMFPGQPHAFANKEPYRSLTLNNIIHFLQSIGYLPASAKDVVVPPAPVKAEKKTNP